MMYGPSIIAMVALFWAAEGMANGDRIVLTDTDCQTFFGLRGLYAQREEVGRGGMERGSLTSSTRCGYKRGN
jgi:hypothetical protein